MQSLSFDSMVGRYDETRSFDKDCFDSALTYLVARFPVRDFGAVLEPGVGNGRIAIPLAERQYRVTGVDISQEMLAVLRRRLVGSGRSGEVSLQRADTTRLPFSDGAFDMALVVHLFYFIREWRRAADEILRVIRPDGPVVLMHTGMGAEVPFLNQRYRELCAEQGCSIEWLGVRSTKEVAAHFEDLGCRVEWIRDRWRWVSRIRLDVALGHIRSRAYSFSTFAPDDVHVAAVDRLQSELEHRFGCLSVEAEVENQIYFVVVER